ncbi:hypothetical protein LCGC14_0302330 [marine sediment metagenome]|uniref:Protein kinase domain-containing protein n=1 Tax=marine sediment metagenome TaxID=412755 RepID=A0A0F9TUU4_9ZZZZ|nr:hypothetical protein [Phycisphaerae bacterium]HDZ45149.1 hypothetical protein [Phycisphaerae bacterium]
MANDDSKQSGVGLPSGTKIGKYEVREKLGVGGMSVVYKCYDAMLDRFVAAKQISPHLAENRQFLEHFRKEAQILARLGSEQAAIVTIHDLVEDERGLFIVMEYVEGPTLEQVLASPRAPMAARPTVQLLWRLAGGMAAVHGAGIIHRDLKPGNILLAEGLRPKITDFGVAASLSGQTSMLLGTTKYMAPELFSGGEVDGRTDMYSLGLIIYELLLGREAFDEIFSDVVRDPRIATVRWMKWHGNDAVAAPALHEANPSIPKELSDIVAKMMAKNPDARYENMAALGRAIKNDLAGVALPGDVQISKPPRPAPLEAEEDAAPDEKESPPAAPAPPVEQLPTAAIPKRSLSHRTRIILAAAVGVLIIAVATVAIVKNKLKIREAHKSAMVLYQEGADAYKEQDYLTAAKRFEEVQEKFSGGVLAQQASVKAPMARAHLAIEAGQWSEAVKLEDLATERVRNLQKATENRRLLEWTRTIVGDISGIRRYRMNVNEFEAALAEATELADQKLYRQAIQVLKSKVPREGFSAERASRLEKLLKAIQRKEFETSYGDLAETASAAAEGGEEAKALSTYQRMLDLLSSDLAYAVSPERRQELRDQLKTQRDRLLGTRELREVYDEIAKAQAEGKAQAELTARRKLEKIRPSNENQQRILLLRAGIEYDVAMNDLDQGRKAKARERLVGILLIKDDYEPALKALGKLNSDATRQRNINDALKAYDRSQWDIALKLYATLLKEKHDSGLQAKANTCEFKLALANVDQQRDKALAAKDKMALRRLLGDYERISEIDPSWIASDITPRVDEIDRVLQRWDLIEQADVLAAKKRWAAAKAALVRARSVSDSNDEVKEIEQTIRVVEYNQFVTMGRAAMDRGDLQGANAFLRRAKERMDTPEVIGLLNEVAKLIAEQEAR